MRWPISEPTPRNDPAASPGVCATASRESRSEGLVSPPLQNVEALWKRQTAAKCSSYVRAIARRAVRATGRGRPQHLLAPYKQEVARSSRAPPIPPDHL